MVMKRLSCFMGYEAPTPTTSTKLMSATTTTSSSSSSSSSNWGGPPYKEMPLDQNKQNELVFKILVVGDIGAGKTAIIRRAVDNVFSEVYKSTIGVDFALKLVHPHPNVSAWLQLWDIAGQERYGNLTRVYYQDAVAGLVVFDMTRLSSFEAVRKWKADVDEKVRLPNGDPIPVILVANKADLVNVPLNDRIMDEFCKENGFVSWVVTSAKKDINISGTMVSITQHVISRLPNEAGDETEEDESVFQLTRNEEQPTGYGCCYSG